MRAQLTLGELQARFAQSLQLQWLEEHTAASALILCPTQPLRPWIGTLDAEHSPQLIVINSAQLESLPAALQLWEKNPHSAPRLIIISDTATTPLISVPVPCLYSSCSALHIQQTLAFHLAETLTATQDVHGVFLRIHAMGVLLSGTPGCGKSELALQLIQQGHALIADDAPVFYRSTDKGLTGLCFPVLANFLEVRSLGLLNILAMYGSAAITPQHELDLIIHLQQETTIPAPRRLAPEQSYRTIESIAVRQINLAVRPGRALPVLIDALVRQHRLQQQGYDAVLDFNERQSHWMEHKTL